MSNYTVSKGTTVYTITINKRFKFPANYRDYNNAVTDAPYPKDNNEVADYIVAFWTKFVPSISDNTKKTYHLKIMDPTNNHPWCIKISNCTQNSCVVDYFGTDAYSLVHGGKAYIHTETAVQHINEAPSTFTDFKGGASINTPISVEELVAFIDARLALFQVDHRDNTLKRLDINILYEIHEGKVEPTNLWCIIISEINDKLIKIIHYGPSSRE